MEGSKPEHPSINTSDKSDKQVWGVVEDGKPEHPSTHTCKVNIYISTSESY